MIKTSRLRCWLPVACTLFVLGARSAYCAEPQESHVEAIVSHPELFDGKLLRISAYILSDRRHSIVLLESRGATQGVALFIPQRVWHSKSVQKLLKKIYSSPVNDDSMVRGVFTGTFEWHPRSVPSRVLSLVRVSHIETVTMNDHN
jgi:hypothetical protein